MKQLELIKFSNAKSYGGNSKKRKTARPIHNKRLHHVVMKSQLATGRLSFKNICHRQQLENLIYEKAHRYGIRIAEFVNVGNHFHLLIRFNKPHLLKTFFRVTLGLIARIVTKAQKGNKFGRFWDGVVFTRIVSQGLDEARIFDYLMANRLESAISIEFRKMFEERRRAYWLKFKNKYINKMNLKT